MDDLEKKVLSVIQTGFPVTHRPYEVLAKNFGVPTELVAACINQMRQKGVIRRLGAVFDSRSLGYYSTLVAANVPDESIDQIAGMVNKIHGVTHNYRRQHTYNLWFTLTATSKQKVETILAELRSDTGIDTFFSLPALKVYKIRVNFDLAGTGQAIPDQPDMVMTSPVELNEKQKHLVRILQESLPDRVDPFDSVATELDWSVDQVIQQIDDWIDTGVIRRFGAVVRHQTLGFSANGMSVYSVADDNIDIIGYRMAKRPEISHCYHRPTLPGFPYSLFGMIHGNDQQAVQQLTCQLAAENKIEQYDVLFSTTEYKKVSMKYFIE